MSMKRRKPQNPSLRFQTSLDTSHLTKKEPERALLRPAPKKGGRNTYGRITVRHRGGGHKKKYRVIDFKRSERDVTGTVKAIEYDPNRNVDIALIAYLNGAKRYILRPESLHVGDQVMAGENVEIRTGNAMPLYSIPVGFTVHNVEITPNSGGTFARSAGSSIQLVAKEGEYATLKMPSGEVRMVHQNCWATIGTLGNAQYKNITWGKAGRKRYLGFRPTVRGMVMNPIDHPHGGGEARSKSNTHPVSPWGKGAKGTKTRKRKSSLIIRRRNA